MSPTQFGWVTNSFIVGTGDYGPFSSPSVSPAPTQPVATAATTPSASAAIRARQRVPDVWSLPLGGPSMWQNTGYLLSASDPLPATNIPLVRPKIRGIPRQHI